MEEDKNKGNPKVAEINYNGSSNEVIGEYIFFGMAAF